MLDLVMRSEAHFAALLFAELRCSPSMRERFAGIITKHAQCDAGTITDIFVEPAPFRDGWKILNKNDRESLLNKLIQKIGSDKKAGDFNWMFDARGGLRSPATWNRDKMNEEAPNLRPLHFLFSARADLLVLTTEVAAWVELKVVSRTPPTRSDSYSQLGTQKDIATYAPLMVQELESLTPLNLLIQRQPSRKPDVATWEEVVIIGPVWNFDRLFPRKTKPR
jgi:hypothetical protein